MVRLHNLLTDKSKARRSQRILLNVQVTLLAWILEFLGTFIGSLMIFSQQKNMTTRGLGLLTTLVYSIVVPSAYLINDVEVKNRILKNKYYLACTKAVSFSSINRVAQFEADNEESDTQN